MLQSIVGYLLSKMTSTIKTENEKYILKQYKIIFVLK